MSNRFPSFFPESGQTSLTGTSRLLHSDAKKKHRRESLLTVTCYAGVSVSIGGVKNVLLHRTPNHT